ncbi:MAG: c-type cytochrome [Vicinamibacterales bacterium]
MSPQESRGLPGLAGVLIAAGVVAAIAVAAGLRYSDVAPGGSSDAASPTAPANSGLERPRPPRPVTDVPEHATEEYGQRLVSRTVELLGPDQPDPTRRYSGGRLNCASCHLATGTDPGTLALLQTAEHYPRFSGRAGLMTDVEDRINECMQRSMNGRPLPLDSPEMIAMAAYLRSLGSRYEAMGASLKKADEPPAFKTPARAADVQAGATVFVQRCAACHGSDGLGLLATGEKADGYLFPPLWGPDSFNNGAGMHRVLTAARFIKARMPLGEPTLSDGEAFDVAAFINSKPRPEMPNLEVDYPDRTAKPIDNPYGPFADDFPLEQHKYGPFQPIEAHYKALRSGK